jgi:hypothetical protein
MKPDMEYQTLEPSGEFAASIDNFRSAVTHVAERETAKPVSADWLAPARKRHRSAQLRMGFGIAMGWACAAALCVATLPLVTHSHPVVLTQPVAQSAAEPASTSDTALLDQVDTNISEEVPSSLAPLAELDSLNATSEDTTNTAGNGAPASTEKTKNVVR